MKLVPITMDDIQAWLGDFAKKARSFELSQEMTGLGIEDDGRLIGYFILQPYQDSSVDIVQGYLQRSARHKDLPSMAMALLESQVKQSGFTRIRAVAQRSFRAYSGFMRGFGFTPSKIVFEKVI